MKCLVFAVVQHSSPPAVRCIVGNEKPPAPFDDSSARVVLKEAKGLLLQILTVLSDPSCNSSSAARSFGLARAHARTLLDHLARVTDER